jgi:hypothetical protein
VIPTSNQDGRQPKIEKGGDEIKEKCSLMKLYDYTVQIWAFAGIK